MEKNINIILFYPETLSLHSTNGLKCTPTPSLSATHVTCTQKNTKP